MNDKVEPVIMGEPGKPKIVLLFPSPLGDIGYSLEIPLSILSVAAPLHEAGYEVVLIDERINEDPEADILAAVDGALCFGVSTITGHQLKQAIHFSRLVRQHHPEVPIIWGGYHPSLLPEQIASEDYVDAVVKGQGERTIMEIVARLEEGRDFDGVYGVTYRNASGEVVSNPDRLPENVDNFPRAPYELLDIERFFDLNNGRKALQYASSQGCPQKCTFCVEPLIYGGWSGRGAEKMVDEIEVLYRRYGVRHISFSDANFSVDMNRVEQMCNLLLDKDIHMTWTITARSDQLVKIQPETFRLMHKAGCHKIEIGVESGSATILDYVNKKTTTEKAIASNKILKEAGIQGVYSFMVGFPKELPESENEIWQTLMLIKNLRKVHPDVMTVTFYVTPYPGTPIYTMAKKLGLKMPEKTEEWADWESTSVSTTWITKEEKDLAGRCNNFYFMFAYPNRAIRKRLDQLKWKPVLYPLHWAAAFRCKVNFYGLPVEWRMMKMLGRVKRFRRVSSQIDALRGY